MIRNFGELDEQFSLESLRQYEKSYDTLTVEKSLTIAVFSWADSQRIHFLNMDLEILMFIGIMV